jgi:DNA-binding transcriptional MerR regulator
MAQMIVLSGVSRVTINSWMMRGILKTPIAETAKGVARAFSRENALEIYFTAALARTGIETSAAAVIAREWIDRESAGHLPRFWSCNPRIDQSSPFSVQEHDLEINRENLSHLLSDTEEGCLAEEDDGTAEPAAEIQTIDRGSIVSRIDRIVDAQAADDATKIDRALQSSGAR